MICIYPRSKKDNKYIDNFINVASKLTEVIEFSTFLKHPFYFRKIRIFHFNWIENHFLDKKFAILEYIIKAIFLLIIKIFNKKIIWTFHNKIPHESTKSSVWFNRFMIKISDKILIHSLESKKILIENGCDEQKIYYIPHGNYIGNYNKSGKIIKEEIGITKEKELTFMFIGQIRKYKNIEVLINAFYKSELYPIANLLIVGKCNDELYFKELERKAAEKDIKIVNKFIPDEELVDYIEYADAMILPYDLQSSLNSASIILSFSYARTVVAPNIGTLKDMKNENFYYAYEYTDGDKYDHERQLIETLNRVKRDYERDRLILKKKGKEAFEYVQKYYSWDKLTEKIATLYK